MISDNLPDIDVVWKEYKRKRIKAYPQNVLRASSIGFPCDAYHYHSIVNWKDKGLHDEILQSIFDEGSLHEIDVMRQLTEMGFQVVEQQRSFQIETPKITGHIDGILRHSRNDYPFDVKSISPYDFAKIASIEDLLYSKKVHQRNYAAQMQLYLLMTGNELGFLLMKNKITGELKSVWCQIDYDYCEQLLKRAERVYKAIEDGKPPECCNDYDICKDCAFKHICMNDIIIGKGVEMIDDLELSGLLSRREDLKASAKEYEDIDDTVKKAVTANGVGEKLCGEFIIKVSEYTRTVKVPETWHEEKTKHYRTQIMKLKEGVK